jgi:hypothetical protein
MGKALDDRPPLNDRCDDSDEMQNQADEERRLQEEHAQIYEQ